MNVNSINSIAFSAKTKSGNKYEKTNVGKISGPIGGIATLAGFGTYFGISSRKKAGGFFNAIKEHFEISKALYQMSNKEMAVAAGGILTLTFLAGAVIDAIANKSKAKNANN